MKVLNLTEKSSVYTCNVYLVTGTWNRLSDINTLIDVGTDPAIIHRIKHDVSTGLGKHKVEQVVITHNHYDHTEILPKIKESFHPKVLAYSASLNEVDKLLVGGEMLLIADRVFEIIYAPGHSSDSIFLYCEAEGVLFSGDNPLRAEGCLEEYPEEYRSVLRMLGTRSVRLIYPGHGPPLEGSQIHLNDYRCNT